MDDAHADSFRFTDKDAWPSGNQQGCRIRADAQEAWNTEQEVKAGDTVSCNAAGLNAMQ